MITESFGAYSKEKYRSRKPWLASQMHRGSRLLEMQLEGLSEDNQMNELKDVTDRHESGRHISRFKLFL